MERKTKRNIVLGTVGTLALGGLALKRKAIASHIRNIKGKAVRVKGTGLPKPNKKTGVVDVYAETINEKQLANRKANTAKVQQRLAYLEEQSPFIKLTKRKKERAREIKRISKQYPYPFSRFVGLIEFARPKGSKDKKKRKRRSDIGLAGSGIGAVGLGIGSNQLNKAIENKQANLNQAIADRDLHRGGIRLQMSVSGAKSGAETKKILKTIDEFNTEMGYPSVKESAKKLYRNERSARKALSRAMRNKKLSKYGAIGLAGLSALELGRRGINKYRNRNRGGS